MMISFLVLNDLMRKDFRKNFIERALKHHKGAPKTLRKNLDEALGKLKLTGSFRNPLEAPLTKVLPAAIDRSHHSQDLMGALLQSWVESQPDLRTLVDGFLRIRGALVVDIRDPHWLDGFQGHWGVEKLFELVELFHASHSSFSKDDIALMLCCLAGRAPLIAESEEESQPDNAEALDFKASPPTQSGSNLEHSKSTMFEIWLSELRNLPFDAPQWTQLTEFVNDLHDLANEKESERKRFLIKRDLEEAIKTLIDQTSMDLEQLEMENVLTWTAEACDDKERELLIGHVNDFREMVLQYLTLAQSPPVRPQERLVHNKKLEELVSSLLDSYEKLNSSLAPMTSIINARPEHHTQPSTEYDNKGLELPDETSSPDCDLDKVEIFVAEGNDSMDASLDVTGPAMSHHEVEVLITEPHEFVSPVSNSSQPLEIKPEVDSTTELAQEDVGQVPRFSIEQTSDDESIRHEANDGISPLPKQLMGEPDSLSSEQQSEIAQPFDHEDLAGNDLSAGLAAEETSEISEHGSCPELSSFATDVECPLNELAGNIIQLSGAERSVGLAALTWRLIEGDRTGLAWHLTRRLESAEPDVTPSLPSWLVRSVALSPHVCHDAGLIAASLTADYRHFSQSCFPPGETEWNHSIRLLLAAATMRPALLAPQTNAPAILHSLRMKEGLSNLYALCDAIARFGDKQKPLDPAALRGVRDQSSWKKDMDVLTGEISDWWKQATSFTILFAPATKVWKYWLQRDGLIERLIRLMLENNSSRSDELRAEAIRLADEKEVLKEINFVERHILDRPSRWGITGKKALGTLVRHVREVLEFSDRWIKLWERHPGQALEWTLSRARNLQETIARLRVNVLDDLDAFRDRFHDCLPIVCAAKAFRRAFKNIGQLFDPDAEFSAREPVAEHILDIDLLHFSSMPSLQDAEGQTDELGFIHQLLRFLKEDLWDWRRTFELHCEAGNHQNTMQIIEYLRIRPDLKLDIEELSTFRNKRLEECRDLLRREVEETRKSIEGALAFGFLKEKERDEYNATVQQVSFMLPEMEVFQPYQTLLTSIRGSIFEKKQSAIQTTRQHLNDAGIASGTSEFQRISGILDQGDVLTANEYIGMILRGESLPDMSDPRDEFKEFFPDKVRLFDKYMEEHPVQTIMKQVKARQDFCGINMSRPTGKQADQAAEMLDAWFTMKKNQKIDEKNVFRVFSHLGFFPVRASVRHLPRRMLVDLNTEVIRDRNRCPVAAFGSGANGLYRILFLWDRPPVDELINEVTLLPHGGPLIVCHFGRMSEQRWRELGRQCKERRRNLMLIDDSVVLYLCGERGSRLPVLFDCSLPFTFLEPFVTTAGLVPPEMFYGRLRERASIIDPMGSCFIYGGRQLGKTALLRDVERTVNEDKENGQNALWVDLKVQGIGYDRSIDQIWTLLTSELKRIEILPAGTSPHISPERLFDYILDWLKEDGHRRILLLLDESDRFLDIDGKQEFINSSRLKGLMDRTNRRFKSVFAGLHNVQRSTNLENHPLAHYGEPICIGPLLENGEWREARALVERPFASLGYRFESPDLVTRILSQTNYYPSLVQLYCQQLLDHVSNPYEIVSEGKEGPPYIITSQHVEDAYQSNDLRKAIRDRFIWTLQLDQRYQVIAYSIAYGSTTNMEMALAGGFSVEWIREEALSWWAKGFERDPTFESFRVLLEEMVGLGILRLVKEGHYGLRSPNVITLMGTQDEIEAELLFCSQWEAPAEYEAAAFRNAFPQDQSRRSPLTAQQESELKARKNGIHLIFGTKASGLDEVAPFLKLSCGDEFFIQLDGVADLNGFSEGLKEVELRQKQGTTLFLVSHHSPWNESWIYTALDRIKKLKSKTSFAHFIFLVDSKTAWYLSEKRNTCLQQMVEAGISFMSLKPWNDAALRQWLEDCSFGPRDQEGRSKITSITGNWPILLREFWGKVRHDLHNWERHLDDLQVKLTKHEIADSLATDFGIEPGACRTVLQTLHDFGEASSEDLSELMETTSPDIVRQVLAWADLLNLAFKTGKSNWRVNPLVGRTLETIYHRNI